MTNFDPKAKPRDDESGIDALSSPFDRFRVKAKRVYASLQKHRLNRAAKRKALLTECGKTLTPDQRAIKLGFGILFEGLTLLLGLIFIWLNAIFFFLQNERVDMSVLKPSAGIWFTEKFDGQSAELDRFEVQYREDAGALALVATGVIIKDRDGEALLTVPKLDSQFDLRDLIFGRFVPRRTSIEGGAVTVKRAEVGNFQFGLGKPESFGRFGPDFTGGKAGATPGAWRNIENVSLKNVELYFINELTDADHRFTDVSGEYVYADGIISAHVDANLTADIAVPVRLTFDADDAFDLVEVSLNARGINPSEIAPVKGRFSVLRPLNAPVDISAKVTLENGNALDGLDITVSAGQGEWTGGDAPAGFTSALIRANYDVDLGQVNISRASLASKRLKFSGSGIISAKDNKNGLTLNDPFDLNLDLTDIFVDPGEGLERPIKVQKAGLEAHIDPAFREAGIKNLNLDFGRFDIVLSGDIAGKTQDGPFELSKVKLSGRALGALNQNDVLHYWPVKLAPAARAWVKRSIVRADVSRLDIQTDLTAESFERGFLLNDELTMSFPINNARVKYISTMTPMTQASGSGVLRGNSFSVGVDKAVIGNQIDVFNSRVDIERFQPIGGDLTVTVNGRGPITPLLNLIDEPPFGYAEKFGIEPEKFTGGGVINYVLTRPVGVFNRPDLITHTVSADFSDVTAPVSIGPHQVQNGQLHFDLDASGLRMFGPVTVGPWPAQFSLIDSFEDAPGNARYRLAGTMTRDDFDRFGIGFREYFTGDVGIIIEAVGNGLSVDGATISADLGQADLRFGDIWSKPAGQAGTLSAMVTRSDSGGPQISGLRLNAQGLDVQGRAKFGNDLRLLSLNFPVAKLDGFIDSALIASTPAAGELALTLRGEYLNLDPWVAAALSPEPSTPGFPLGLSGTFSNLKVRNDMVLTNAALGLTNSPDGLKAFTLSAEQAGKPLRLSLKPAQTGAGRDIVADIPDAGAALSQLFNLGNIAGGRLQVSAKMPAPGAPGPVSGIADMEDFKLVDAPVFARMLSLASLSGLGEVLSGDGMNFTVLKAPFSYEEQQITLNEARASGPAIGVTASGIVDFDAKTMDVDGVLVPAYTVNSVLGNVPVLGDIIVGKDGEGVFALNYSLDGDFKKTQVAVNPLSAFAPGFLRRIFDPATAPKTPKPPED